LTLNDFILIDILFSSCSTSIPLTDYQSPTFLSKLSLHFLNATLMWCFKSNSLSTYQFIKQTYHSTNKDIYSSSLLLHQITFKHLLRFLPSIFPKSGIFFIGTLY
jgi:hypothetical protein